MKKLILTVLAFVVTFSIAVSQDKSSEKKDGPVITFEQPSHDFGDIEEGTVVTHKFKFKNTGNQPLILANVITSCGCTSPEWPKEPIAPGKTGEIKVGFNSAGRSGVQPKTITVVSNAVNSQERVNIKSNVLPKAQ